MASPRERWGGGTSDTTSAEAENEVYYSGRMFCTRVRCFADPAGGPDTSGDPNNPISPPDRAVNRNLEAITPVGALKVCGEYVK
jgi:hypothetical protein